MDKSQIPTKSYTFGEGEYVKEVSIYEWITQQEEDEYQEILLGDQQIGSDVAQKLDSKNKENTGNEFKFSLSIKNVNKAKDYLVKAYLASNAGEYDIMRPDVRLAISQKIEEIHSKKK